MHRYIDYVHNEKVLVARGEEVITGEIIALSGDYTDTGKTHPHVYLKFSRIPAGTDLFDWRHYESENIPYVFMSIGIGHDLFSYVGTEEIESPSLSGMSSWSVENIIISPR